MSENNNAKEFQDSNTKAKMSILDRTAEYSEGIFYLFCNIACSYFNLICMISLHSRKCFE